MAKVGFYGLGSMGTGMATNLQNHLQTNNAGPLYFSNRTVSKGDPLKALGAIPSDDFGSLVQTCDVIFLMISNDAVLTSLIDLAITSGSLTGKIIVDTSTVHPDTSFQVSEKLAAKGAQFIAAPVFGASAVAAAGKLIFAMAGPKEAVEKVKPMVLNVMAKSIIELGEDVRKSAMLKITGNIMVIGFQEIISEVQVFAEKNGLGTQVVEELIESNFGPVVGSYSKRLTTHAYAPPPTTPPGFAISHAIKDAKHAISIANDLDMRLPALETATSHMVVARGFKGEWLDSSGMYGVVRVESGLEF